MVDSALTIDVKAVFEESPLHSMLHIVISSSSQVFSQTVGSALGYCTLEKLVKLEFAINKS